MPVVCFILLDVPSCIVVFYCLIWIDFLVDCERYLSRYCGPVVRSRDTNQFISSRPPAPFQENYSHNRIKFQIELKFNLICIYQVWLNQSILTNQSSRLIEFFIHIVFAIWLRLGANTKGPSHGHKLSNKYLNHTQ